MIFLFIIPFCALGLFILSGGADHWIDKITNKLLTIKQHKKEINMTVKDILVHLEKCGPERILEILNEKTPKKSLESHPVYALGSQFQQANSLLNYQQVQRMVPGGYIQYVVDTQADMHITQPTSNY